MLLGNVTKMQEIDNALVDLQRKTERILWLLEEMKASKKPSVIISKPIAKSMKDYPQSFIDCVKGRYKTIAQIQSELGLTETTVRTYIKLARKDGLVFNTKRSDKFPKGTMSYKLKKGA